MSSDGSDSEESEYPSDPKVIALKDALQNRDPFYVGACPVQDYQRLLHYTDESAHQSRRIDFYNAGSDDLEALYRACQHAEFGRNGVDESYLEAGKMDTTSFSTLLDPHSLGIYEQVSKALLTESHASMEMQLYKLNVYGKGDFFKAHKATLRSENMFGSLIVMLPTLHEGGQFLLRRRSKEWTIDFADKFTKATVPSVFFVAFRDDVEHGASPIVSGYRVTLTYNLYHKSARPTMTRFIPTPFHLVLRQALADLVNDTSRLPNGGYLGFGLVHEYVHTGHNLAEPLLGQLKGSDHALADTCDALGLHYSIKLLYRDICDEHINLLTTEELDVSDYLYGEEEPTARKYLANALEGLSHEQVEGVSFVDHWLKSNFDCLPEDFEDKIRIVEVLEVTPMKSSVDVRSPVLTTGSRYQGELQYFYGTACVVVAVDPVESRRSIVL